MLNPSTADDEYNDQTINRVIQFSTSFGFGGFYVGNLFSYIATKPKEMIEWVKFTSPQSQQVWKKKNDNALIEMVGESKMIIFAWGSNGGHPVLQQRALEIIKRWKGSCLDTLNNLHPGHPLYLSPSCGPYPYLLDPSTYKRERG
jgi:hypothetical protein